MTEVAVWGMPELKMNFAPRTIEEEVIQNIRTIITTPRYSVPLDRAFGVDGSPVDRPMPAAQARHIAGIIRAVQKYEKRVKVLQVVYEEVKGEADQGKLVPKVRVVIHAGKLA